MDHWRSSLFFAIRTHPFIEKRKEHRQRKKYCRPPSHKNDNRFPCCGCHGITLPRNVANDDYNLSGHATALGLSKTDPYPRICCGISSSRIPLIFEGFECLL